MSVWTDKQFDPFSLVPPLSAPLVSPPHELDVVLEMLASLGTLTQPGQRFTMFRISEIIRDHVRGLRVNPTRNQRALDDFIALLGRECDRQWPDVETFDDVAQSVLLLLKGGR